MKKLLAILLVLTMMISLAACGKKDDKTSETTTTETDSTTTDATTETETETTETDMTITEQGDYSDSPALVLAVDQFNGVFSPFFATTGVDRDISDLVHAKLLGFDRSAQPDNTGLAEYVTPLEEKDADGNVTKTVYTFQLKEGVRFSDGTPVTADDIIFSFKVLSDPMYTGSSTIYTSPIAGINEYRYDAVDYADKVAEMQAAADAYEPTDEEIATIAQGYADAYGMTVEEFSKDGPYYADYTLTDARANKFSADEAAYIEANLADGMDVTEIEGIKKLDERTVEITLNGVDPKAIYNIGAIDVAPVSYYGEGFTKGDLSMVEAKDGMPMGAGPYRFLSYENNVVSLVSNDFFFKGAPITKKIKYQVSSTTNKLEGVKLGEFDISDPAASTDMVAQVEAEANIHYELIDNLGYGYIGIDAERITDKNVRKGIMYLMDRKPAVQSWYGNLASVIERPISRVSWAYPKDSTEYYGFNIEKAQEAFAAAGYELVDGKLVKDGKPLTFEISIPADGTGAHPSYPIILGVKNEGEKIGLTVNIIDYADGNKFFDDLEAGLLDVWCAAWQATADPDMYQTYHSQGPSNYYGINDARLDEVIVAARQTSNIEERKVLYAEALDIIMDWAVEMPVYQRKNMYIFNKDIINIDTLPKDMTPFYGYLMEVEKLELLIQ
ncbi:MAG: ABC transporter substrate-binding protein [Vallitaleaceae bacterium]|nr:ABC transporter substrate-binding protein [Vallitaleaceae bacterium]